MHEDPELQRTLKTHADYFVAPGDLRASILGSLRKELDTRPRPRFDLRLWWRGGLGPNLAGFGAAFAAGIVVTLVGIHLFYGTPGEESTVVALLSDHSRALLTDTTIEVASSSSHTVKPWLSAKLGYSPNVVDLAAEGFPLVGGRRSYLEGVPIAVMVYGYKEHEIDLYALRADPHHPFNGPLAGRDGYNIRSWELGGMRYVAVSDVAADRLDEFARRIQTEQDRSAD